MVDPHVFGAPNGDRYDRESESELTTLDPNVGDTRATDSLSSVLPETPDDL